MRNILVAIDFEEKTKNLLDNAKQLAEKFGSKIWIIHIFGNKADAVGMPETFQYGMQYISLRNMKAEELKKDHKLLHEYKEQFINDGILAEGLLIEGPTVTMILDEALKLEIDLIIIGSHKHSFLYNALMETISSSLIRKSNIPLLVVPM
jgi:nucleotide-binding universal stress UspA family protein